MQNHYNDLKPIAEMMYPDPAVEELKAIADKMRLSERLVDMNQVMELTTLSRRTLLNLEARGEFPERVRTVANKSKMKVAIIQAIDRKVALDDIALSKGIEFSELLDEVEAIVYSGTKLNIDYFLDEIMDEDHMLDIYDYFKESTTDKIDDALDELGDEFTEEEVRLVRIKFISEMAN